MVGPQDSVGNAQDAATWLQQLLARVSSPARWLHVIAVAVAPAYLAVSFLRLPSVDPISATGLIVDRSTVVTFAALVILLVIGLLAPERAAMYVVAAGASLSFGLCAAFAVAGVSRGPRQVLPVVVACIGLSLAAIVGARLLWILEGTLSRGFRLSAIIVSTVALPAVQIWSSATYLPQNVEVNLEQAANVSVKDRVGDDLVSVMEYSAENKTGIKAEVIASQLMVCWWKGPDSVDLDSVNLRLRDNCQVSQPITERAWVPANSTFTWSRVIKTPVDSPVVTVQARLAVARGDRVRLALNKSPVAVNQGPCKVVRAFPIQAESRLRQVVERPRFLVLADFDGDGGRDYFITAKEPITCPQESRSELSDYLGVVEEKNIWASWLEEPKNDSTAAAST